MKHDFEFYETPQTFVRYLASEVAITGDVFEPCVGTGAILTAMSALPEADFRRWETNDLDPRHPADTHLDASDRLLWEGRVQVVDWTISNPPFEPCVNIINHALRHSRVGVAMHLRASIHEVLKTGTRRTWLSRKPPTGILWLPRFAYQRSQTTGKWTTDSVCACWVVWIRDPTAGQFIRYAPERVLNELDAETPAYRRRMDALMTDRTEKWLPCRDGT